MIKFTVVRYFYRVFGEPTIAEWSEQWMDRYVLGGQTEWKLMVSILVCHQILHEIVESVRFLFDRCY